MRVRILDLYCGVGGASRGYADAGWEVVGVDIIRQPDYPYEFHRTDALTYLAEHWAEFDAVHASPPCQSQSALTKGTNKGREYPNLIPQTRAAIARTGLPSVMENVVGSELRPDVTLCGELFNLAVIRHRVFELGGWSMPNPPHIRHRGRVRGWRHGVYYDGPYLAVYGEGGGKGTVTEWQEAMGIDWTESRYGIAQAIPPAYTQYIGEHLAQSLGIP